MISDRVKNFILSNRDLINIPGEELVVIANDKLFQEELKEFYSILKSIGIDIDKERWEFFEDSFLKTIDYYKSSSNL